MSQGRDRIPVPDEDNVKTGEVLASPVFLRFTEKRDIFAGRGKKSRELS